MQNCTVAYKNKIKFLNNAIAAVKRCCRNTSVTVPTQQLFFCPPPTILQKYTCSTVMKFNFYSFEIQLINRNSVQIVIISPGGFYILQNAKMGFYYTARGKKVVNVLFRQKLL